jgi:hypothetical protein
MRLRSEITKRARKEVERAAEHWEDPTILWDELRDAGERLLVEPLAGRRWVSSKGRVMWRLLLPRTQNQRKNVMNAQCVELPSPTSAAPHRPDYFGFA